MCGISFYFFECYCTYSRNFDRSGRASGRDKASTASKGRSNKFVPRNRSRNRLKTRKGSQDRDNSAPYLLRFMRECVEKYTCNRSTASLVYACHANAYARHVRFPGVTAPSLVVIRVPRLLPALVRPINAKKKKTTYRLPIEPLNRWYHDRIQTA